MREYKRSLWCGALRIAFSPADRSGIVFQNNQWLEASQLAGWADFQYNSGTPAASLGILIMAVVQFTPSTIATHPFCKCVGQCMVTQQGPTALFSLPPTQGLSAKQQLRGVLP